MAFGEEQNKDLGQTVAIKALEESLKRHKCQVALKLERKGILNRETNLVIEQRAGQGLALGYDRNSQSLWVAPDASPGVHYWNTNTDLRPGSRYPGIEINPAEEGRLEVKIASNHPVSRLVAVLQSRNYKGEIRLAGEGSNWDPSSSPTVSIEEDGGLRTVVSPGRAKLALSGIKADWRDANWQQGAKQRLEIK